MTTPTSVVSGDLSALTLAADAAGLTVVSSAAWPETVEDVAATPLAGFIDSTFSPLVAEVGGRALRRRDATALADAPPNGSVTAIVIATIRGDVTSAIRVAAAVDSGRGVPPLHFFQSVPNSIAGYLAARWGLTGPVVCVSDFTAGVEVAALLITDGDADAALVVSVDLAVTDGDRDRSAAIVVTFPDVQAPPGMSGK